MGRNSGQYAQADPAVSQWFRSQVSPKTGGNCCEGFRMPAATDGSTGSGGRRPKASKERNRDGGTSGGAAGSMGIWPRRIVRLLGFDASESDERSGEDG